MAIDGIKGSGEATWWRTFSIDIVTFSSRILRHSQNFVTEVDAMMVSPLHTVKLTDRGCPGRGDLSTAGGSCGLPRVLCPVVAGIPVR